MAPRHLINADGSPFSEKELVQLTRELDALTPDERQQQRNENAQAIARHTGVQILIVAGPGTGKSTLFKQRILYWLQQNPDAEILALSFVRKLVADLNADIQNDATLTDKQKAQVDVLTLHKYARSVVEKNHGSRRWMFARHFRIIGQFWKIIVWNDVLLVTGQNDHKRFSWPAFEKQLHDDKFETGDEWTALNKSFFTLCQFYNAAGFSDLIIRATIALTERPELNEHHLFIIDEYQDFNVAEEKLLEQIAAETEGKLIVGDDDQVLYETLKSGKASLIRAIYKDKNVVNAMLPFCSRCDFHIVCAASAFINQATDPNSIRKIYLPIGGRENTTKVQAVACATPATAVDYIRKLIEDRGGDIEQRKVDLAAGNAKDAYFLILSPSAAVNFYRSGGANERLFELIKPYGVKRKEYSDDYYMVLSYYSLANYPTNNFTFRKVLYYQGIAERKLLTLLKACLGEGKPLCEYEDAVITEALAKADAVKDIVDLKTANDEKVKALAKCIPIAYPALLREELEAQEISKTRIEPIEHGEEEEAELAEIEVKQMSAVELMPIVRSKGLSADHVFVIGFDNVNLGWVTRNAFYVAMTRARKSLHLITALKAGGASGPSHFLDHLPDKHLAFSKYTKGTRTQEMFRGRAEYLRYIGNLQYKRR